MTTRKYTTWNKTESKVGSRTAGGHSARFTATLFHSWMVALERTTVYIICEEFKLDLLDQNSLKSDAAQN